MINTTSNPNYPANEAKTYIQIQLSSKLVFLSVEEARVVFTELNAIFGKTNNTSLQHCITKSYTTPVKPVY